MLIRFARQFPWLVLLVTAVAVADTAPHSSVQTRAIKRPSFKPAVLRSESGKAQQTAYSGGCKGCDQSSQCCPRCQERCFCDVSKEDVKKYAWDIDCEKVCIPRVSFPWQLRKSTHTCHGCGKSCCDQAAVCSCGCPQPAKCAKVRTVKKLVKHEYTCKKCKYTWTVKSVGNCTNGNCTNGNCEGGCASNPASPTVDHAAQNQVAPASQKVHVPAAKTARLLRTPQADATLIPRGNALPPLPR